MSSSIHSTVNSAAVSMESISYQSWRALKRSGKLGQEQEREKMKGVAGAILLLIGGCLLLGGCFLASHGPAVTMSIEPSSGYSPLPVHLEAHAIDKASASLSYEWEFGEGQRKLVRSSITNSLATA